MSQISKRGEDLAESESERELLEWGRAVTGPDNFVNIQVKNNKRNKNQHVCLLRRNLVKQALADSRYWSST